MRIYWLVAFALVVQLLVNDQCACAQGFKFLEVKVVGPDGKPMADVPVEFGIGETSFPMPTDDEGKVAVNVPTSDNSEVEVSVKHEGYTAMAVGWRGDKVPEQVTIPLTRGVAFGGIVHDQQGRPVEGVNVSGEMVFENRHGMIHDGEVAPFLDGELATTDEKGHWMCSMAPEGKPGFQLRFMHPEFLDEGYHEHGGTWEELKGMKKIVVLEKGITLDGKILDPKGQPIPRAFVEAMTHVAGSRRGSQTFSEGEGEFQTHPLPPGNVTLSVNASGFAPLITRISDAKSNESLSLQLEQGRPIRIKVVNSAGEPLAGTRILVTDWHYPGHILEVGENYETDKLGNWQWEYAPEGKLTYDIWHPSYMQIKQSLVASEEVHVVVLGPRVKITGSVIDKQTREPVKKFRLTQIASIDCGEGCNSLIAYGDSEFTAGGYSFQTGLLCKESYLACSAKGYKSGSSRTIKPKEDEVQWDFELERIEEERQ